MSNHFTSLIFGAILGISLSLSFPSAIAQQKQVPIDQGQVQQIFHWVTNLWRTSKEALATKEGQMVPLTYVCKDLEVFEKSRDFELKKDYDGLGKYIMSEYESGNCINLPKGAGGLKGKEMFSYKDRFSTLRVFLVTSPSGHVGYTGIPEFSDEGIKNLLEHLVQSLEPNNSNSTGA